MFLGNPLNLICNSIQETTDLKQKKNRIIPFFIARLKHEKGSWNETKDSHN